MSSDSQKNGSETKDSKQSEDPGLAQFKEEALQNYIIEKALLRPEANCCTYSKGYITQECFLCTTCFQETQKRHVICLGCSVKCHDDNHEIIPIGFKRKMRCDCGNNNFFIDCKLKKKEDIEYDNPQNIYNHNMENKYCYCDMEDDGNSTMAQCFFCEDWFHKEHLYIFGGKNIEFQKNEGLQKNENTNINSNLNNNDNNNKDNDNESSEELPILDLVCKNCVKKLKDILIGYDLNEILYGLIPHEKIKIIHLDDKNIEEKKENNSDKDKEKEQLKEEKKEEKKELIKMNKKEDDNINSINITEEEKDNNTLLLGKKRKIPFTFINNINEEKKEDDNIDNIINTNNIIMPENIDNNKEKINEPNNNYINNNNNNIAINHETSCKRKISKENEELLNNIILNEQNIFIDCEILLKILCRCKSCQEMYRSLGFDYLNNENLYKEWESRKTFDDVINDEKFIDEAERENPISLENVNGSLNDFFNSKEYKQLTCEQQIIIRGCIGELGNKFAEFVSTLNHTTITVEDIYAFFNKYRDYFEELKYK